MLKLAGSLPRLSWDGLIPMLRPGQSYLDPEVLFRKTNPYSVITNPRTSDADIASGAEAFRSHCAMCHAIGGSAPDLAITDFHRGSSDWALFRTVSRGIAGTEMKGLTLQEESIWQVIAYVRSLRRSSNQTDPPPDSARENSTVTRNPPPQVSYGRLLRADQEPGNWLTYSGTYASHRYSLLSQINRSNVQNLNLKWAYQMSTVEEKVETTPLVVENIMYLTEPPNNVLALDAKTGRRIWSYRRKLLDEKSLCCGGVNRGLAVLGDKLYLGTLDSHLVALDGKRVP